MQISAIEFILTLNLPPFCCANQSINQSMLYQSLLNQSFNFRKKLMMFCLASFLSRECGRGVYQSGNRNPGPRGHIIWGNIFLWLFGTDRRTWLAFYDVHTPDLNVVPNSFVRNRNIEHRKKLYHVNIPCSKALMFLSIMGMPSCLFLSHRKRMASPW